MHSEPLDRTVALLAFLWPGLAGPSWCVNPSASWPCSPAACPRVGGVGYVLEVSGMSYWPVYWPGLEAPQMWAPPHEPSYGGSRDLVSVALRQNPFRARLGLALSSFNGRNLNPKPITISGRLIIMDHRIGIPRPPCVRHLPESLGAGFLWGIALQL